MPCAFSNPAGFITPPTEAETWFSLSGMSTGVIDVSVAGVVIDENGRTLVIQRRDNGHWEPPGGVLELDESILSGESRPVTARRG